jgi:hypothetical protein
MEISVYHPRRKSVSGPAPCPVLTCDDRTLIIDTAHMQPRLVRLIPFPTALAKPKDWRPFCSLAIAMGLL